MAKQKQLQLLSAPITKKKRSGAAEGDFPSENGWVVVKKQIVTIFIPALPVTKQNVMHNLDERAQPASLRNAEVECSDHSNSESEQHSVSEREKTMSPAVESPVPAVHSVHPLPQRLSASSHHPEMNNVRVQPSLRAISTLRVRNQALLIGDGMSILSPRMRAFNIEKKLKRAGGLDRWLASLGLQCFVKTFHQRKVNKFQLENLTMNKLKDMGVHAVGPRRKLMHAMDCLCQPYCFERGSDSCSQQSASMTT